MPIRPNAAEAKTSRSGEINYRLARAALVSQYESGLISLRDVCDAHPELVRAAREIGEETTDDCPICEKSTLVLVRYVFGPRLPSHGRCISLPGEMARIAKRKGDFTVYEVEACPKCAFNHLKRSYPLPK